MWISCLHSVIPQVHLLTSSSANGCCHGQCCVWMVSTHQPKTAATFPGFCKLLPVHPQLFLLIQPNPAHQFTVEVKASDTGVAAVLSQKSSDNKTPYAFFSHRLSPAERNCDIGNQLNSHWARWALFFGRFNFALTYHPGSCNIKPDALSCQYVS